MAISNTSPRPYVVAASGDAQDAPAGAIPIAAYGFGDVVGAVESVNGQTGKVVLDAEDVGALPDDYVPPVDTVVTALIAAGFGAAGEVLATNATGDGFEWVTP